MSIDVALHVQTRHLQVTLEFHDGFVHRLHGKLCMALTQSLCNMPVSGGHARFGVEAQSAATLVLQRGG